MSVQNRNAEMVELLAADFPRRNEPNYAWGNAVGGMLWLPGLRLLSPLSNRNSSNDAYDLSGQGRTLTQNNGVTVGTAGLVSYSAFTSASSQYYARAHELGLNPTSQLWGMAWVRFGALGAQVGIISKYLATTNFAYRLIKTSGDVIRMQVTSDGTSGTEVTLDHSATIAVDTWYHLAFRFNGAITEMRIWVNGADESKTSGVPATVFNATGAAFEVGRSNSSFYLEGDMTLLAFGSGGLDNTQVTNVYQQTRPAFGV